MSSQPSPENGGQSGASPLNGVIPPVEHRFKPGNPGGPGRPRERPFREAMEKALKEGRHSLDKVVDDLFTEASKGNVQAIKEVREVMDGKSLDVTSGGETLGGVLVIGPKELEDV